MPVDYSRQLAQSAEEVSWKTADDVAPSDVSNLTHQLRYQASRLGLDITIRTSRKYRTVSFLAWRWGTKCPLEEGVING